MCIQRSHILYTMIMIIFIYQIFYKDGKIITHTPGLQCSGHGGDGDAKREQQRGAMAFSRRAAMRRCLRSLAQSRKRVGNIYILYIFMYIYSSINYIYSSSFPQLIHFLTHCTYIHLYSLISQYSSIQLAPVSIQNRPKN